MEGAHGTEHSTSEHSEREEELEVLRGHMLAHIGEQHAAESGELSVALSHNGTFAMTAWALARVAAADTLELAEHMSTSGGPFAAASVYLERQAQLILHQLCLEALSSMPTSVAEDEQHLATLRSPTPRSAPAAGAPTRETTDAHQAGMQRGDRVQQMGGSVHGGEGRGVGERGGGGDGADCAARRKRKMRREEAHRCSEAAVEFRICYKKVVLRGLDGTRERAGKGRKRRGGGQG